MTDLTQPTLRLVARSVDEQISDAIHGAPDATLAALSRLAAYCGVTPNGDRCSVSWRAKGRPTPGWKGTGQHRLQRIEAQLARHNQQLGEHAKRIAATEQRCATLDARVTDAAYEFDMLSRMTLRNARRLDRLDRPAAGADKDTT